MPNKLSMFAFQVEKHREFEPDVIFIIVPKVLANEFDILHKKWENSILNQESYLPKWGRITRLLHVEGVQKVETHSDDVQTLSFADWSNMVVNMLGEHMKEDGDPLSSKIEDELIFFIGEFTLLRDGAI